MAPYGKYSINLALLASLFIGPNAWAMCAMCKKAAEESQIGFLQGIYWSLILIGGIPITVFILCAVAYRRLKRKSLSL